MSNIKGDFLAALVNLVTVLHIGLAWKFIEADPVKGRTYAIVSVAWAVMLLAVTPSKAAKGESNG